MGPKKQLAVGLAIGAGILFLFGPALLRVAYLESEEMALRSRIAALRVENQQLIQEAKRLREDSAYLEAVARKELGFARPGETVIKFKDQKSAKR